jgi:hypothetical protein
MKRFTIVLLLLCGCDSARAVSSDGSKDLGECWVTWVRCLHDACPDGYDIISKDLGNPLLVRCRPAPKVCP